MSRLENQLRILKKKKVSITAHTTLMCHMANFSPSLCGMHELLNHPASKSMHKKVQPNVSRCRLCGCGSRARSRNLLIPSTRYRTLVSFTSCRTKRACMQTQRNKFATKINNEVALSSFLKMTWGNKLIDTKARAVTSGRLDKRSRPTETPSEVKACCDMAPSGQQPAINRG